MLFVGMLAVVLGVAAAAGGAALWALTEFKYLGKQTALYGLAALLFGLMPIILLWPKAPVETTAAATEVRQSAKASAPKFELRLKSFRCSQGHGFAEVIGQIINVSDRPIKNVMAYGTFTANNGDVINTGSALIDFQPIMPGQTSSFKVMAIDNPLIRKCGVQIGTLFGGRLSVDY
jgi:hypothetical protein